ncbi:hypothetical protein L5014_29965 [Paraburkholderia sp. RG36]|uniref:Uncharacterized protein n=2 Tax=Paraburkholderia tagetis TaxID=2913261 RepID=A0A9X1ULD6_9BURK|nr:hypothetical protein [Paraburkholderia tagetis]
MNSLGPSITPGEADEESSVLVTILALGQRAIEAGDYRDIGDFLAQMDEENYRESGKVFTDKESESPGRARP